MKVGERLEETSFLWALELIISSDVGGFSPGGLGNIPELKDGVTILNSAVNSNG